MSEANWNEWFRMTKIKDWLRGYEQLENNQ